MRVSDSHWHHKLSRLGEEEFSDEHPYWLGPFKNYRTFCPYLVGSYARVGEELRRYIALGFSTFILDIPKEEQDFHHIARAFDEAWVGLRDKDPVVPATPAEQVADVALSHQQSTTAAAAVRASDEDA